MYRYLFFIGLNIIVTVVYASCDPFTIQCHKTQGTLTKYPLSELSMKGSIYKADKKNKENQLWAIIQTPDNHVYSVTKGNTIGLEGGRVLHISSQSITVQQEKNTVTILLQQVK